jgi:hypothetical protein
VDRRPRAAHARGHHRRLPLEAAGLGVRRRRARRRGPDHEPPRVPRRRHRPGRPPPRRPDRAGDAQDRDPGLHRGIEARGAPVGRPRAAAAMRRDPTRPEGADRRRRRRARPEDRAPAGAGQAVEPGRPRERAPAAPDAPPDDGRRRRADGARREARRDEDGRGLPDRLGEPRDLRGVVGALAAGRDRPARDPAARIAGPRPAQDDDDTSVVQLLCRSSASARRPGAGREVPVPRRQALGSSSTSRASPGSCTTGG